MAYFSEGVLFDTLGAVWKQLATTSISVHGSNSCGPLSYY